MQGLIFVCLIILCFVLTYAGYSYKKTKNDYLNTKKEYEELLSQITELQETKKKLDEAFDYKIKNMDNLLAAHEEGCNREYNEFKEDLDRKRKALKEKYDSAEATYKSHYLELMEESANDFSFKIEKYNDSLSKIQEKLDKLRVSYNSRIEVAKREQEEQSKRNYYRWQLDPVAIEDIKRIQSVKSSLSSPDIIDKILWKTYYEKATNDLITRVIGNKTPCGIYKITNLLNEKVYIGQSVDVKARLKQHVKSGVGAVAATNNKLYTSMKQDGLWNFTWEVIEECPREKLNEREAFWIDFYDAAGYGLNGNRGVGN